MNEPTDAKTLVIFGASHATCLGTINGINRAKPTWKVAGFLDDTPELQGNKVWGYPVLGDRSLIPELAKNFRGPRDRSALKKQRPRPRYQNEYDPGKREAPPDSRRRRFAV